MNTPYPVAARELLRDTILDAARDQLGSRPWSDVTMAHVAANAGVSRQTIYNEFGSRERLAQALVLRETDRFLAGAGEAVAANAADPRAAVAAAFDGFLRAAAENPLFREAISGEREDLLPMVTTEAKPAIERAVDGVAAIVLGGWPAVSKRDARLFSEAIVRLAFSSSTVRMGPDSLGGAGVVEVLGPFIDRVLGEGPGPAPG